MLTVDHAKDNLLPPDLRPREVPPPRMNVWVWFGPAGLDQHDVPPDDHPSWTLLHPTGTRPVQLQVQSDALDPPAMWDGMARIRDTVKTRVTCALGWFTNNPARLVPEPGQIVTIAVRGDADPIRVVYPRAARVEPLLYGRSLRAGLPYGIGWVAEPDPNTGVYSYVVAPPELYA